jgi:hypothetical protein
MTQAAVKASQVNQEREAAQGCQNRWGNPVANLWFDAAPQSLKKMNSYKMLFLLHFSLWASIPLQRQAFLI